MHVGAYLIYSAHKYASCSYTCADALTLDADCWLLTSVSHVSFTIEIIPVSFSVFPTIIIKQATVTVIEVFVIVIVIIITVAN